MLLRHPEKLGKSIAFPALGPSVDLRHGCADFYIPRMADAQLIVQYHAMAVSRRPCVGLGGAMLRAVSTLLDSCFLNSAELFCG